MNRLETQTQKSDNLQIDLNFAIIDNGTNDDQNKEADKDPIQIIKNLHNKMFVEQNQAVVVGYLNTYNKENLIQELPYLLQQMEFKQLLNQKRKQILIIFHYVGGAETEPITLIKKAKNKYRTDPIIANEKKEYSVQTNLDLQKVKEKYQSDVQTEAEPFKIKEDINDEDVNKLYFLCLKECEAKKLKCILIQVNKVNKKLFTEARIASRIFQILIRWEDIRNNHSTINQTIYSV
ncbi:unnamed protein product [Paramecium sonneborni]|uniref:Uncharacterized protein n=1 Tax=Paramecium sonneborni TaxID=65129 RepID=A0A8S1PYC3_9CILI|nr:unnamed protein product [Paramecium sonneborni]